MTTLKSLLEHFAFDRRSLIAFRSLLAVGIIVDLFNKIYNAKAFYSESGLLPQELWHELFGHISYRWSLHFFENEFFLYLVLVFHLVLAVCIFIGFSERIASAVLWILMISLSYRNPYIFYGGEKLLINLLLLSAFMPARNFQRSLNERSWLGKIGGFLLIVQVIALYSSSGITKMQSAIWSNGVALDYIFNMRGVTTAIGRWFGQFDTLETLLTYIIPLAEAFVPLLFLVPFFHNRFRTFGIFLLLSLNVGIALMLNIGFFMFFASAALVGCLPKEFWDQWSSFKLNTPFFTNDKMSIPAKARVMGTAIGGSIFFTVATVTFVDYHFTEKIAPYPKTVWTGIRGLEMYQNWSLFTRVDDTAKWYVSKAYLKNGNWVDVLQGGAEVNWRAKPEPVKMFRRNSKWRLVFNKVYANRKNKKVLDAFGRSVANNWNAGKAPTEHIKHITFYKLSSSNDSVNQVTPEWVKYLKWPLEPSNAISARENSRIKGGQISKQLEYR